LEKGFSCYAAGSVAVPARNEFFFPKGTVEAMPGVDEEFFAVKVINTHVENQAAFGLPTIIGFGALVDGENGFPLLIAESTLLTALRTAAASAVATKHLASESAKRDGCVLGIVGAGAQAIPQLHAISRVARVERVLVSDLNAGNAAQFKKTAGRLGFDAEILSTREICGRADVLTTVTCKKKDGRPVVYDAWIRGDDDARGLHVNAVGGDSPGKFELEKTLLLRSKVVVDFYEQAMVEGEAQQLTREQVYAHLGEIVSGAKRGRESESEITVFDSTGFAMEDLVAYKLVRELALREGVGKEVDVVGKPSNAIDFYESYALA
jgi:ornithine cyclodeaminase/alanine dehydrogenase-like protein (mu-crystallin family)